MHHLLEEPVRSLPELAYLTLHRHPLPLRLAAPPPLHHLLEALALCHSQFACPAALSCLLPGQEAFPPTPAATGTEEHPNPGLWLLQVSAL